jgi:hypothetical protein
MYSGSAPRRRKMSKATLIQVDSRKRVTLGNMALHNQYLVREENGTIVLEPAVFLTAAERAVLSDPVVVAALSKVNESPENRRTRSRDKGKLS